MNIDKEVYSQLSATGAFEEMDLSTGRFAEGQACLRSLCFNAKLLGTQNTPNSRPVRVLVPAPVPADVRLQHLFTAGPLVALISPEKQKHNNLSAPSPAATPSPPPSSPTSSQASAPASLSAPGWQLQGLQGVGKGLSEGWKKSALFLFLQTSAVSLPQHALIHMGIGAVLVQGQ